MANSPTIKVTHMEIEGPEKIQVNLDALLIYFKGDPVVSLRTEGKSYWGFLEDALARHELGDRNSVEGKYKLTQPQADWLHLVVVPLRDLFVSPGFVEFALPDPVLQAVHMYERPPKKGESKIPVPVGD